MLLARLAADAGVHVVLSLRDDFLLRCFEQAPLAPSVTPLTILLPLKRDALRRALVEPARKRGYRFEDEALVDEMVESVAGARGALPLLAFAVARLWEKRDRRRSSWRGRRTRRSGASRGRWPSMRKPRWTASGPSDRPWCGRSSGTW